ncbi:flavodoxin family protein [Kiritimatiella glycovorans]|uniref:2-amino-4-deoxychorismate dehydrogenase n=1 Tax=Kiritimatiella glycovorans TaxID=1307763 RepID=A0A0G3EDA1_9BACT|nr:flavodoxin family protein [Kiritimatiella glycovorans]AKJ63337.1 2-amino-4-deoxychorismate dehydrogenase [Kiritimatiella glycovorans]
MKVTAICGSPRNPSNTKTALNMVLKSAAESGLDTELIALRDYDIRGCTACGACRKTADGTCPGRRDGLNDILPRVYESDALVIGSPVYFGSASAETFAFLQRTGYVARGMDPNPMRGMIGAGVAVARRAGQNFTVAEIEMSFGPLDMTRAGSLYWPVGFGAAPGDLEQDEEATRTFAALGKRVAELVRALR